MAVSLDSQLKVLERIKLLRPADLVRAGLTHREAEAFLLHQHLSAAVASFKFAVTDDRVRLYIETKGPQS